MLNNRPPSKSKAVYEGICGFIVLAVLLVFFYLYAYTSPDEAGCWIGTPTYNGVATSDKRVVWPSEEHR